MNAGGIYEIVNSANGKRYIGSAKSFAARWAIHRSQLRSASHANSHLQSAWLKYGASAFSFQSLLICAPKDLLMYEQRCIDALHPDYNICLTAGNTRGRTPWLGKKHSVETRSKFIGNKYAVGNKMPRDIVDRLAAKRVGVPLSAEHRAAIGAGNKGRFMSAETRAKLSVARTGQRAAPAVAESNRRRRGEKRGGRAK